MPRQYLLVDFENVQPANLGALKPGEWDIRVFVGQHQTRLDLGLVQAVQAFGANAQYIQIVGNGKDALDFHIAFYIGKLSVEHPGSSFVIVSRDTGFDPLIKHLDTKLGIACKRVATIPGAAVRLPTATKAAKQPAPAKQLAPAKQSTPAKQPAKQAAPAKPAPTKPAPTKPAAKATRTPVKKAASRKAPAAPPRQQEVIDRLRGMKHARPRTVKTLRSSLASFNPPFADADIDRMLAALQHAGVLRVEGTKIVYDAHAFDTQT
jgi:hypothetical protein